MILNVPLYLCCLLQELIDNIICINYLTICCRATLSDGRSQASSRDRAYRRLVNNSTKRPLLHVDLLKTPSGIMNDKTKQMPVVKLKVGEIIPSIKRSHTIAQMNNLRGNFGNYSHYRIASADRRLPSLSESSHASSHSQGDNSIVFILRGMPGSKSPKPSESQASGSARSPVKSNASRSPLFKRTFKIVKSTDRVGDISTPSLHQINGYEIRGSSLLKTNNPNDEQTVTNSQKNRVVKITSASGSLPSRPTSYLTSRLNTPSQSRDYSAFDRGEGYLDEALVTRAPRTTRKVHFEESKRISNLRFLQDRVNESQARYTKKGSGATPLQLTIKNLEMFDYLSDTKKEIDTEIAGHKEAMPNDRVLSWVKNTPPISDIPEEPEMNSFRENLPVETVPRTKRW